MNENIEKAYNISEVADILGIKVRTVRQWISDGKIQATKIAGTKRWIIMESEIKRLRNGK